MSTDAAAADDVPARGAAQVVVRVEDSIEAALTGRAGAVYESPPQSREQAMALVRLLLSGDPRGTSGHESRWTCPVAGGRRTITVTPGP